MILILDGLVETISNWWNSFLENTLWRIFWFVEVAICKVMGFLEEVMMVFTGETEVTYKQSESVVQHKTLINVFFSHQNVRGIYGAMGLIGIIFAFCFAIVQIVRPA